MKNTGSKRKNRSFTMLLAALVMVMGILTIPQQGSVAQAGNISIPSSAKEYNGHYYKAYKASNKITWDKAQQYCEAKGGHLVTITSAGEATFVEKLTNGSGRYWIGGYCSNEKFKWVTGEKWSYNCFGGFGCDGGICLSAQDGYWYDDYYYNSYYICEWDTSRDTVLPDQVTFSSLKKVTSTSAMLSWKKVSGAKGYTIYMKTGSKGSYKKIKDVKSGSTTAYYKTKLKKGQTYYFRIRAYKNIYGERSYGELSAPKKIKMK